MVTFIPSRRKHDFECTWILGFCLHRVNVCRQLHFICNLFTDRNVWTLWWHLRTSSSTFWTIREGIIRTTACKSRCYKPCNCQFLLFKRSRFAQFKHPYWWPWWFYGWRWWRWNYVFRHHWRIRLETLNHPSFLWRLNPIPSYIPSRCCLFRSSICWLNRTRLLVNCRYC